MIYLFLGDDNSIKDQKIAEIKNKWIDAQAVNFDYEVLDAVKLDSDDLKKALVSLPAVSSKRVVVIHRSHKLDSHNKELILNFSKEKNEALILILEGESSEERNSFIEQLSKTAKVVDLPQAPKQNIFDMTKCMEQKRPAEALKVLSNLMTQGHHPLQMMGVLVWFWGKTKNRLAPEKFQEGLEDLKEADLDIKRSRLKPEFAMELLVAKLCLLIV